MNDLSTAISRQQVAQSVNPGRFTRLCYLFVLNKQLKLFEALGFAAEPVTVNPMQFVLKLLDKQCL